MTTSGVEGDLQMHGAQKNPLTIPTTRCPNPSTALYLVSPPLPAGVSTVQFHIVSHDQGWTDNPQGGLWTWFEVSIFRPLQSELNPDFPDVNDAKFTKSRPDDFGNMIQELGFYFAYIPGEQTEQGNTVLSSVFSLPVAKNTANRDWQHHSVTWTLGDRNGEGNQFLSLLEEGDRLAIWARAQFPGWMNFVKEAQISISKITRPALSHQAHTPRTTTQRSDRLYEEQDAEFHSTHPVGQTMELPPTANCKGKGRLEDAERRIQNPVILLPTASNEDTEDGVLTDPVIHYGIFCDGPSCTNRPDQEPIKGARYKCTKCVNTDFCLDCVLNEANPHDKAHPLMKCATRAALFNLDNVPKNCQVVRPSNKCPTIKQHELHSITAFKAPGTTGSMTLSLGQDTTNTKIHLARLLPGTYDTPILLEYSSYTLKEAPPYIACACLVDSSRQESKGSSDGLASSLESVLRHLRGPERTLVLWNEQVCIDQNSEQDKARHVTLLRAIYKSAVETVIWAGGDHVAQDSSFDVYLGPGDTKTTEHAFSFAARLAEAPLSDIPELLGARYPPTNVHSWSYLFRILCRPFWRSLALLRTNYAASLRRISVQCASTRIPLPTLQEAARRIRTFFPPLDFLYSIKQIEQNKESVLKSDYSISLSCIRFGVDDNWVAARIFAHARKENAEGQRDRFIALIGAFSANYEFEDRLASIRAVLSFLDRYDKDPASFVQDLISNRLELLPASLPWEGPLAHPPKAEDQAPFVHPIIDRSSSILLVKIVPASALDQPLQCGLVEVPKKEPPEFGFVTNSTFLRKAPDSTKFHGVEFPISTRSNVPILANCQAFVVPRIQEVFLRLVRDSTQETYVFLWNICMYNFEANMESRDRIEGYMKVKEFMKEVGKAKEVDMYAVLEMAGKKSTRQELEAVGLPKDLSWDDWLLELND